MKEDTEESKYLEDIHKTEDIIEEDIKSISSSSTEYSYSMK